MAQSSSETNVEQNSEHRSPQPESAVITVNLALRLLCIRLDTDEGVVRVAVPQKRQAGVGFGVWAAAVSELRQLMAILSMTTPQQVGSGTSRYVVASRQSPASAVRTTRQLIVRRQSRRARTVLRSQVADCRRKIYGLCREASEKTVIVNARGAVSSPQVPGFIYPPPAAVF